MSSPKAAAKKKTARSKVKTKSAPARNVTTNNKPTATALALKLAAEMDQGIETGEPVISEEARQKLMAALCKVYSLQIQAGVPEPVLDMRSGVSPTDVMITCSGFLKAADLQVFELGMWQSWTGR
jgi:hypothetical protein